MAWTELGKSLVFDRRVTTKYVSTTPNITVKNGGIIKKLTETRCIKEKCREIGCNLLDMFTVRF